MLYELEVIESQQLYLFIVTFKQWLVPLLDEALDARLVALVVRVRHFSPLIKRIQNILSASIVIHILLQSIFLLLGLNGRRSQLILLGGRIEVGGLLSFMNFDVQIVSANEKLLHGIITLPIAVPVDALNRL